MKMNNPLSMQNTVLMQKKTEQAGHTYYEGPGSLLPPDSDVRPVADHELLDITDAAAGTVVRGGTLRQVAPRTKWTHQLWLDPQECIALKRSTQGRLEPLYEHTVQRSR